jgi:hypothetical protein
MDFRGILWLVLSYLGTILEYTKSILIIIVCILIIVEFKRKKKERQSKNGGPDGSVSDQ